MDFTRQTGPRQRDLSPIAFAGWLGVFVTALNLLPASQLDGGHVIYALFWPASSDISRLVVVACVLMVVVPLVPGKSYWPGWLLWAVLMFVFGLGHPVTADIDTPLIRCAASQHGRRSRCSS